MEQLVYNTLPLSYLWGILGVKGFMLASIKHKGVTFNCVGDRRWDKTNYLYSLTAVFYLTSALGPFLCWPVGSRHEKINSLGCNWAGFFWQLWFPYCQNDNSNIQIWWIHSSVLVGQIQKEYKRWLITYISVISFIVHFFVSGLQK